MQIQRILVGTDFSEAGSRAVTAAAAWARRFKASLRIVHTVPAPSVLSGLWRTDASMAQAVNRQASAALKRLAEATDPARELDLSTGLLEGSAAKCIRAAAQEFKADLVIAGARGEGEGATRKPGLGSTSSKLVATTTSPLLLVRRAPAAPPMNVLAAVDLSAASGTVLDCARLAASGGKLDVLHVYEMPFAARLEAYGIAKSAIDVYSEEERRSREQELSALVAQNATSPAPRCVVQRGDAATVLMEHAQSIDADVIVFGKHVPRAERPESSSVGSVCQFLAVFSPTNVLIVPPWPV